MTRQGNEEISMAALYTISLKADGEKTLMAFR